MDEETLKGIMDNKENSVEARKDAYLKITEKTMNPSTAFDPKTFDPISMFDEALDKAIQRKRVEPSRKLPTMGMMPKEIMEGQMIGMYESKQDLYLMIAWLSERVSDLEDELLKKGI